MADCDIPTISLPEITCLADLRTWGTQAEAVLQAAIDHIVGCIQDFEIPALDICVSKDDLVTCPLDCNMMNFEDATYADEGGVCVLPLPPNLGDYEFRHGTGLISPAYGDAWRSTAIVFDTPFTTELLHVSVTVTASGGCPSGVNVDGNDYAIIVQGDAMTVNGCTVWIYREDHDNDCTVAFTYFAVGN